MPTDASVLKSSHSWLRHIVIALIVMLAVGWTTFVAMRMVASYRIEHDLEHLRAAMTDATRMVAVSHEDFGRRLTDLERTVYAVLEPRLAQSPTVVTPRSPAELWQRNRDVELYRRLLQLERWRLEVESRK